jgi:hypothetical protein
VIITKDRVMMVAAVCTNGHLIACATTLGVTLCVMMVMMMWMVMLTDKKR